MAFKRPFGVWDSPLTPKRMARQLRLSDIQISRSGAYAVWLENRSSQGVLVAAPTGGGAPMDLTAEHSVRARVGYGGGDFTVGSDAVFFVSEARLWKKPLGPGVPVPITEKSDWAISSPTLSPDERWIVYVYSNGQEDGLAAVDSNGDLWPQKLTAEYDFFMQPTFDPSGQELAFVAWNHPNMPWDNTELLTVPIVAQEDHLKVGTLVKIAGGDGLVFQPTYSPDGRYLAFVHEVGNWSQVMVQDRATLNIRQMTSDEAEYAPPAWAQGERSLAWMADSQSLAVIRSQEGVAKCQVLNMTSGTAHDVSYPEATYWEQVAASPTEHLIAAIVSGDVLTPRAIVTTPDGASRVLGYTSTNDIATQYMSRSKSVVWTSQGTTVYGLYYAPVNPQYVSDGLPPLVVLVHGGPTGHVPAAYSGQAQFFTSRGYAVLAVNYRGSTGYGREYRKALEARWGIFDVEDAVSGAQFCVEQGWVNGSQLVIMGGSAGGYTVLKTLVDHPGVFKAGVCLFGVSNLFTLAAETHKFESRYLDSMLGPLPQARTIYHDRSPIFHAKAIRDALAVFQGDEDVVVPRNQADTLVEILQQNGVPHIYEVYPGEGHGWRGAETIERFYTSLYHFLVQYVIYG